MKGLAKNVMDIGEIPMEELKQGCYDYRLAPVSILYGNVIQDPVQNKKEWRDILRPEQAVYNILNKYFLPTEMAWYVKSNIYCIVPLIGENSQLIEDDFYKMGYVVRDKSDITHIGNTPYQILEFEPYCKPRSMYPGYIEPFKDLDLSGISVYDFTNSYKSYDLLFTIHIFGIPIFSDMGLESSIYLQHNPKYVCDNVIMKYKLPDKMVQMKKHSNTIVIYIIIANMGNNIKSVIDDMDRLGYFMSSQKEITVDDMNFTAIQFEVKDWYI